MRPLRRHASGVVLSLWLVLVVLVTGAAACATMRRARAVPVEMAGFLFKPARVDAAVGDTIVWKNSGIAPHTVTADSTNTERWDSGSVDVGKEYRMVASARGTFAYHCVFHPSMTGTIVVR